MKFLILSFVFFFSSLSFGSDELIPGLANESSAGLIITSGNSKTQTYDLNQKTLYKWSANTLTFTGGYLRAQSAGVENARRFNLGLRYERDLATRWGVFVAEKIEGDRFAGILQRYSTDLGGRYSIVQLENFQWKLEAGYRYLIENRTDDSKLYINMARFYTEAKYSWNAIVTTGAWLEYLQSLKISDDRFLNSEINITASLSKIFSVRTGYLLRYRNIVPANVVSKTDTTFTTALVAKF